MGCKHYAVGCKIKGECCGNFVTCRFCHDKKYSHEIDRFATKIMKCMFCFTVQNIAQTCANCQKVLGCFLDLYFYFFLFHYYYDYYYYYYLLLLLLLLLL